MEPLEARVKVALERAGYSGGGTLLVVAVSGGADSLALLHSLLRLRESTGLLLHLAHLNHNFRGEEAEEDARFASNVARELGLPATVGKADPLAYQRDMGISSFEEAAREVRYNFLAGVVRETGAAAVALGHNADDLAETVLMHIIRGSGIHGLRGMTELARWRSRDGGEDAVLFRPLLEVAEKETAAYCLKGGIAFREDQSNRLSRFTRNRVRHELMPAIESYNPRIREALARLSRSACLELDYLEQEVYRVWPSVASKDGHSITLDSKLLSSLHPFIQRMVLRRAYEQLTGDTRRLGEVHLSAMADFISALPGRVLGLPRGLRLHAGYGQLVMGFGEEFQCPFPPLDGEHELPLSSSVEEQITEIPGWLVGACLLPSPATSAMDPFTAWLDPEAIGENARIRTRLPGDRFQPLGMRVEKKLQDFFVDEKVPRTWRDRIPLFVSGRGIAWVVGYRVAEWGRAKENGGPVCQVRFSLR